MLLLPDLNRANSKKQLQYNIDLKEDNFENNGKDASFCSFQKKLAVVMDFLTLQDKHNVHTLSIENFIYTCFEKGRKMRYQPQTLNSVIRQSYLV